MLTVFISLKLIKRKPKTFSIICFSIKFLSDACVYGFMTITIRQNSSLKYMLLSYEYIIFKNKIKYDICDSIERPEQLKPSFSLNTLYILVVDSIYISSINCWGQPSAKFYHIWSGNYTYIDMLLHCSQQIRLN